MYVNKDIADKYQEFYNFMSQEHNLTLTISEMDEIVMEAQRLVKKLSTPNIVGQSEQLKDFADYAQKRMWEDEDKDLSEFVDEFLNA